MANKRGTLMRSRAGISGWVIFVKAIGIIDITTKIVASVKILLLVNSRLSKLTPKIKAR